MDIRLDRFCWVVVSLLLAAPVAMSEAAKPLEKSASPSDRALLAGLWSLTTQPQAITLADLTKKLRMDLHHYKVDGGPRYYEISALDDDQVRTKAHTPIRFLTLWSVGVIPGVLGNQELRVRLDDDVCVSTSSAAPYADSPVMTEWVPCTDGAACGSEMTYFFAAGQNKADKRLATGSQLRVARECSQGVVVAKTFDKDYWLALCPFNYNKQVHDSVIADVKNKYPDMYASFDLEQPRITDYGGPTMTLNFREPASAPRLALLSMEVDRCDQTVIRSWLPPQPK